jgi:hypothetical protein
LKSMREIEAGLEAIARETADEGHRLFVGEVLEYLKAVRVTMREAKAAFGHEADDAVRQRNKFNDYYHQLGIW